MIWRGGCRNIEAVRVEDSAPNTTFGRLVYVESYDDIEIAIQREKTLKRWPRVWKIRQIERDNPDWRDLFEDIHR